MSIDFAGQTSARAIDDTVNDISNEDISMGLWMKVDSGGGDTMHVLSKIGTQGNYTLYLDSGVPTFHIERAAPFEELTIVGTSDLRDDTWHHVAITVDRNNLDIDNCKVYENGRDATTSVVSNPENVSTISNTGKFQLGGIGDSYLDGIICDVRMYYAIGDRWSADNVWYQANHLYDFTPPAGLLTEYYRCNDGNGYRISAGMNSSNDLVIMLGARIYCVGYYGVPVDNTVHDITTQDISFSAWIKANSDGYGTDYIFNKYYTLGGSAYLGYAAYLYWPTNNARFLIRTGATTYYVIRGSTVVRDGEWHHIAFVIDRDNADNSQHYLDGILDENTSRSGTIGDVGSLTNSWTMTLGKFSVGGNWFEGYATDVKLYYAADGYWTGEQVAYQAAHPFDYSPEAGDITENWQCNEGSGLILQGSAGNDLTLSDEAAWGTRLASWSGDVPRFATEGAAPVKNWTGEPRIDRPVERTITKDHLLRDQMQGQLLGLRSQPEGPRTKIRLTTTITK